MIQSAEKKAKEENKQVRDKTKRKNRKASKPDTVALVLIIIEEERISNPILLFD